MFMDWLKAKSFSPGYFSMYEPKRAKNHTEQQKKKGETMLCDIPKQLFMQTCHRQARSSLSLGNGRGNAVNVSNNAIEQANKSGNFRTQEKHQNNTHNLWSVGNFLGTNWQTKVNWQHEAGGGSECNGRTGKSWWNNKWANFLQNIKFPLIFVRA